MGSHLSLLVRLRDNADQHWLKLIGKKGRGANKLSKVFGELVSVIVLRGLCLLFFVTFSMAFVVEGEHEIIKHLFLFNLLGLDLRPCLDRQPITAVDSKGLINVGQERLHRRNSMMGLVVPLTCAKIIFRAAGLLA